MKNFLLKPPAFIYSLSLRTRLILGNLIVTFLAVAGLGFYVYYRDQQNNAFLIEQLNKSVLQGANESLTSTDLREASQLNNFFASAQTNITSIGAMADNLLIQELQESNLNKRVYWDAAQALTRLPNGAWDNVNPDVASVFVPASKDLTPSLVDELNTLRQLDITVPTILKANPDVVAIYFGSTDGATLYYPNIALATLVSPAFDVTQRPWFLKASPPQDPQEQAVWSDPYLDAAHHGLVVTVSIPVYDAGGNFRGGMAMDIQLARITDIVSNLKVGKTGFAFLMDKNYKLIAMPQAGYKELGIPASLALGTTLEPTKVQAQMTPEFWRILDKMSAGQSGVETIPINGVDQMFVYSPLSSLGYSLAIIVPKDQMIASAAGAQTQIIQSSTNTLIFSALLILGILVMALLAAMAISSALTSPLVSLTQTAQEAAQGNFSVRSNVNSRDEIGTLARAFNFMTGELGKLVGRLEERISERTRELERSNQTNQQRAQELQIVADVAQAVASLRDLDSLLPQITQIISERFGYYHTGIFMLDDQGEYAVLRAANSEGGRRMLAREHKLRLGATSIVGTVASTSKPRVSSDVGLDAVYFNNPDLPATHAEMALPLIAGDRLIGVLDIQSTEASAFGREQIEVLTTLANQVAVAIENARLFGQTSRALTEAQKVYNEFVSQSWEQYSKLQTIIGYRSHKGKTSSLAVPLDIKAPAASADSIEGELAFPIRIRNQTIGVLNIRPTDRARRWSENELAVARAAVERAALALENARLLDDAQRRSARERSIGEISTKIGAASDIDSIMRLAVEELGKKLGSATEVTLELGSDSQESNHD